MSREFKKHYTSFSREILAEFMSKESLEFLDKKYNKAKIDRTIKRLAKGLKQ